jgi:uncharacterized protein
LRNPFRGAGPEWRYRGEWALVTGASAGLGEVFAERLAERGMNLVLTARRAERLRALADRLAERYGVRTVTIESDLARAGSATDLWDRAVAAAEGPIHLLVNNAGFGAQGDFHEVDLARQAEMVQLNCIALLELAHRALGPMRSRGEGAIINVSSVAAFQPVPGLAVYAASKAFVQAFSESIASENADSGVRVVALAPGRTPTEFQRIAGTGDPTGAFGLRTPAQVVDAGLRALERGRTSVVPGVENHLASWVARLIPRPVLLGVLRPMVRRRAAPRDR